MASFMVVCTFKEGTVMDDVFAMVAEEQAKVRELTAEGLLGSVYLATAARGTVFLETFADDAEAATDIVRSLPMAKWWDLDVYPLNPPREVAS